MKLTAPIARGLKNALSLQILKNKFDFLFKYLEDNELLICSRVC